MNHKYITSQAAVVDLYTLLTTIKDGITELRFIKTIYKGKKIPSEPTHITRQINRYRDKIEEKYKCKINRTKNKYYTIVPSERNQKYNKLNIIRNCVYDSRRDEILLLNIKKYNSKKGIKDYTVLVIELVHKKEKSYFKGYVVEATPKIKRSYVTLKDGSTNIKRFTVEDCSYVTQEIIHPEKKIKLHGKLLAKLKSADDVINKKHNDSFGFFSKKKPIQSSSFYFTEHFKNFLDKYLSTNPDVDISYSNPLKHSKQRMKYETTITYHNIKNLLILIIPYLDQIEVSSNKADLQAEISTYFNKNL